jgi:membrane protease YdiL (CAAX protease family)
LVDWQDELAPLVLLPAVIIANLAVRERWARYTTLALAAGASALVGFSGLFGVLSATTTSGWGRGLTAAAILLVAGSLGATVLVPAVRQVLARYLPFEPDSPPAILALVGVILIVGEQASYQASHDALAVVGRAPRLEPLDVILQEIPLLLIALFSVGLFTRRRPAAVLDRLGIVRPAPWQLLVAIAAAGAFYALSQGGQYLQEQLDPALARRLEEATSHYYAAIGGVVGILVIALAPGIAEESLFRGALQPRLGILLAAVAFTAVHTQYALTIDTLLVFALGCSLGVVRRYLNTTTAITAHAAYNALAGIGLPISLWPAGVAGEALFIVVAFAAWRFARGPGPAS